MRNRKGPSGPFFFALLPAHPPVHDDVAAAADPNLAVGVDLQAKAGIAPHLPALADLEAPAEPTQCL